MRASVADAVVGAIYAPMRAPRRARERAPTRASRTGRARAGGTDSAACRPERGRPSDLERLLGPGRGRQLIGGPFRPRIMRQRDGARLAVLRAPPRVFPGEAVEELRTTPPRYPTGARVPVRSPPCGRAGRG